MNYEQLEIPNGVPVKMWTNGVPVEEDAKNQLRNIARLPIVFKHVAVMPDVHLGIGATIGSVVPTLKAIIPAAVGGGSGVRNDGVQDHAHGQRPARQPVRRASRHRARRACGHDAQALWPRQGKLGYAAR